MVNDPLETSYENFPYRPNSEDGATNIGGIDLTREPHRIDEIHELSNNPILKQVVLEVNQNETPFMTTGVGIWEGEDDHLLWSYVEFCFRPGYDFSHIDPRALDELFIDYIRHTYGDQYVSAYQGIQWEERPTSVYGSTPVPTYTVFSPPAQGYQDIEHALVPVMKFLRDFA